MSRVSFIASYFYEKEVFRIKPSAIISQPEQEALDRMSIEDAIKKLIECGFYIPEDKWETKQVVGFSTTTTAIFINGKKHAIFYNGLLRISKRIKKSRCINCQNRIVCHNESGPAIQTRTGQFYFINGVQQTKNEVYLQRIKKILKNDVF